MRRTTDWKALHTKEIGDESSVAVSNLCIIDLKVLMKKIGENHHYGLLPLTMKVSRGQLGALNAESFVECVSILLQK